MSIFSNHTLPIDPAAAEIAEILTRDILREAASGTRESGPEEIQGLAPAVILGRTAMYFTHIPDAVEATRALFGDPELQGRIIAGLTHANEHSPQFTEKQTERFRTLRQSAESGGIPVKELEKGEVLILQYAPTDQQMEHAYLKVKRNQKGTTNDHLTLLILDTDGPIIWDSQSRTNLIKGDSVYLGYSPDSGQNHESILEQGAPPAWGWQIEKVKKEYHIDDVYTNTNYTLHQIYYGETDRAPLFQ